MFHFFFLKLNKAVPLVPAAVFAVTLVAVRILCRTCAEAVLLAELRPDQRLPDSGRTPSCSNLARKCSVNSRRPLVFRWSLLEKQQGQSNTSRNAE